MQLDYQYSNIQVCCLTMAGYQTHKIFFLTTKKKQYWLSRTIVPGNVYAQIFVKSEDG